ncbi:MAG TPA: sporulation histidine kinase inhibitor Sda [Paenibacillus sp.]|uniref:sporulation histidine kinase inhibitor Sda n=1 Tax=Paenibacillus sp. TaxID=58172 RepID=UPI0028D02201|nr:sporulation histidine kinase inhibitor Sda [Paenibacillus sp.]HUC91733.1 sporulation histidine kinase inhibitor Sda [Paenibacillus sp.]
MNRSSASSVSRRPTPFTAHQTAESCPIPLQDKTMLLRPLNDEHLLEVYREAKAMNLSDEFIQLIEDALRTRNIEAPELSNS